MLRTIFRPTTLYIKHWDTSQQMSITRPAYLLFHFMEQANLSHLTYAEDSRAQRPYAAIDGTCQKLYGHL